MATSSLTISRSVGPLVTPTVASGPSPVLDLQQRQQDVLGPHVVVSEPQGFPEGQLEGLLGLVVERDEREHVVFRRWQRRRGGGPEVVERHALRNDGRGRDRLGLVQQPQDGRQPQVVGR
ncbi:MAG TPA: hypothetical protein VKA65_16895 [Acidimicrobiales bacterium]|nr:hypothetical protein [Acidimicrobiales bacterium]